MSKAKILIVEDEIITATALRNALQDLGFSICSLATSGEKAIKTAEHELPNIILMDVNLGGGMDGFEAAREIHSRMCKNGTLFNNSISQFLISSNLGYTCRTSVFQYVQKPEICLTYMI